MREKFGERRPNKKIESEPRREFLRWLSIAAIGAGLGGGAKFFEKTGKTRQYYDIGRRVDITIHKGQVFEPSEEEVEEEINEGETEKIQLSASEKEMMRKIMHPSLNENLEINEETIGVVTKYWIHQYQNVQNAGMKQAYSEMQDFNRLQQMRGKPTLQDIFKMYGVPEEYVYLAIPESGWKIDARSKKGAKGRYQFMPETAEEYGLDDPYDTAKSADAAARLLKNRYRQTHSWDLALAAYNGIAGHYVNRCRQEDKEPDYKDYLSFLQARINKSRERIKKLPYFTHTVKKGDTWSGILYWYKIDAKHLDYIKKINSKNEHSDNSYKKEYSKLDIRKKISSRYKYIFEEKGRKNKKDGQLNIGQKITIPFSEYSRQFKYKEEIAGVIENINYPPKINAVLEVLGIKRAQNVAGRETNGEKIL
jgi:hypothetical protein